jgi:copper chaperone CopZ
MKFFKLFIAFIFASLFFISCQSKTAAPKVTTFKISGMTCAFGCAKTIENNLSKTVGIQKAVVNFDNKTATVNYDANTIATNKIIKTVQQTGDGATYKVYDLK